MVESKTRKAAFLREAVRVVGLADATVVNERFESVAQTAEHANAADFVTVRAVKTDAALFRRRQSAAEADRPAVSFSARA